MDPCAGELGARLESRFAYAGELGARLESRFARRLALLGCTSICAARRRVVSDPANAHDGQLAGDRGQPVALMAGCQLARSGGWQRA